MSESLNNEVSERRKDPIGSLAARLRHADTGMLARLRRHHPDDPGHGAAFDAERLLLAAGLDGAGEQASGAWHLVLHCLALAQGLHDARPESETGAVLARQRFSEARVRQLVDADEALLRDLLPRVARRLGTAGTHINWWPLAELVLRPADGERGVRARQRIVSHYVRVADAGDD